MEEVLNIRKPSGHVLEGFLTFSSLESKKGDVIVYIHGTLSDAKHNFTNELAKKLAIDQGLRSYRYTGRFHSTEIEPGHRYKFSGFEDDLDDMKCVISHLKKEGYEPWCLLGHSRGANDALIYASRYFSGSSLCQKAVSSSSVASLGDTCHDSAADASIASDRLVVVAVAPRFNMPLMLDTLFNAEQLSELAETGKFIWHSQLGDLPVLAEDADVVRTHLNMAEVITSIPEKVPILLLHGTDDELISHNDALSYKEARPGIELNIIEGARHAFRGKKQNKILISTISDFLLKNMPKSSIAPKLQTTTVSSSRKAPPTVHSPITVTAAAVSSSVRVSAGSSEHIIVEVFSRAQFSRPRDLPR